jgi:osmotically-inducible protein OsmY
MKSKSNILVRAAVCAVGTALVHPAVADHEADQVAGRAKHATHIHNGVEVIDCTCEQNSRTTTVSYNASAEQERPVVKGTARGGALDLTRNTRPMFNEDWTRADSYSSSSAGARDLAHRDTDRTSTDSLSQAEVRNVGGSNIGTYSTRSAGSAHIDSARDSSARNTQINDNRKAADIEPYAATKEGRERNLQFNRNQNRESEVNEHGNSTVPLETDSRKEVTNRDRLLSRGQTSVQAVPTDGSTREARVDVDLAQSLMAAIKADDSFSADAKNIKVMVENDTVTLRGAVASQTEKDNIEQKARELAGIKQVKNELEIKQ